MPMKHFAGLILGIMSASFAIRVASSLVKTKSILLLPIFFLSACLAFYLTVYLWRILLIVGRVMRKEDLRKSPFYSGFKSKNKNDT
jgi:hypothetical protein